MRENVLSDLIRVADATEFKGVFHTVEAFLQDKWEVVALFAQKQDALDVLPALARSLKTTVRTRLLEGEADTLIRPRGVSVWYEPERTGSHHIEFRARP